MYVYIPIIAKSGRKSNHTKVYILIFFYKKNIMNMNKLSYMFFPGEVYSDCK